MYSTDTLIPQINALRFKERGAGEMSRQLRVSTALAGNLSLVPAPTVWLTIASQSSSKGSDASGTLRAPALTCSPVPSIIKKP